MEKITGSSLELFSKLAVSIDKIGVEQTIKSLDEGINASPVDMENDFRIAILLQYMCEYFKCNKKEFFRSYISPKISGGAYLIWYIMFTDYQYSQPQIGTVFSKTKDSIRKGIREVKKWKEGTDPYSKKMNALLESVLHETKNISKETVKGNE